MLPTAAQFFYTIIIIKNQKLYLEQNCFKYILKVILQNILD